MTTSVNANKTFSKKMSIGIWNKKIMFCYSAKEEEMEFFSKPLHRFKFIM